MNLRLSPESVRLRVSLDEARALERERTLTQRIPLAAQEITIELLLVQQQAEAAKFSFVGQTARALIREREFLDLLAERPSEESSIQATPNSTDKSPLSFVFEIDLFSRKEKR